MLTLLAQLLELFLRAFHHPRNPLEHMAGIADQLLGSLFDALRPLSAQLVDLKSRLPRQPPEAAQPFRNLYPQFADLGDGAQQDLSPLVQKSGIGGIGDMLLHGRAVHHLKPGAHQPFRDELFLHHFLQQPKPFRAQALAKLGQRRGLHKLVGDQLIVPSLFRR